MNSQIALDTHKLRSRPKWSRLFILALILPIFAVLLGIPQKQALSASLITLDVRDYETGLPISPYTYLVNLDNTGNSADDPVDCNPATPGYPADCEWPSIKPMASYSPIMGTGDHTITPLLDDGRYLISVRANGYKLGGAHVTVEGVSQTILVELVPEPLELSRIRVHAFLDNRPVNGEDDSAGINSPDLEPGLEGFRIILDDTVGEVSVDWYGNPLCTRYETDIFGNIQFDIDGAPIISASQPYNGGVCYTDANGDVLIDNLPRGKYEVVVVPPDGQSKEWVQTTTIEGTHVIDAWPLEGDDGYSPREGFLQAAVWVGFVQECQFGNTTDSCDGNDTAGTGTISGTVKTIVEWTPPVNQPPAPLGRPMSKPWISLTDIGATDAQVYLGRGDENGDFVIPNVPDGTYQAAFWDDGLDYIMGFRTITIPEPAGAQDIDNNPQTVNMNILPDGTDIGGVGMPRWFGWIGGYVYMDDGLDGDGNPNAALIAGNGLRDCINPNDVDTCERSMDGVPVGTRFRDGSVQYGTFTDNHGYYEFKEVKELEKFAVVEIDFGRFGRTGISLHNEYDSSIVTPLVSDLGGDLLATALTWAAKSSWIDWGKQVYGPGENGGVSGVVFYATTRNELDIRFAGAEPYEPGIPGVTVRLYDETGTTLLYEVETDAFQHPSDCDVLDATGAPLPDPLGLGPNCIEVPNISNEVKDGAFDGGYAIESMCPGGFPCANEVPLPAGEYIVEVVPPPYYKVIESNDQNTSEGNELTPQPQIPEPLAPPPPPPAGCVDGIGAACSRRLVTLHEGQNAPADFFLLPDFTGLAALNPDFGVDPDALPENVVPIPGRIYGFALDDLNVETDPNFIYYGEKRGIPNTPIGIRDFTGRLITVVNSDNNGIFEVLLPSTYAADCPTPSGVCPNVYQVVMNDPGDVDNPTPNWNPNYQTLAFQFDVWPGKTTYADVATFPITAFTEGSGGQFNQPAQCGVPADVPQVHTFNPPGGAAGATITVTGSGFDAGSTVVTDGGVSVATTFIDSETLTFTVPASAANGRYQLLVQNAAGVTSRNGITFHKIGTGYSPPIVWVDATAPAGGSGSSASPFNTIQAGIDAAADGSIVAVRPGTYFGEILLDKNVKLQGFGPGAADGFGTGGSVIDGRFSTTAFTITAATPGTFDATFNVQVDGFRIANARDEQDLGGGLFIAQNGEYVEISNNVIQSNGGNLGGGIVIGEPYEGDMNNDNIRIHHNRVLNNGGISRAGGIGIYNGTDNYEIDHNDICGNYSGEYGGGISHFGLSSGSSIHHNNITRNNAFDEGGGIMIAGEQFCQPVPEEGGGGFEYENECTEDPDEITMTVGSGDIDIYNNLIQENLSNDDGGGLRLLQPWDYTINIANNMIVNNVSTDFGGGFALDDASDVNLVNNTFASNANTSTAEDSDGFYHAAGMAAENYSTDFSTYLIGTYGSDGTGHPDPFMRNNIFWNNVAYTFVLGSGLVPTGGSVFDIEVVGGGSFTEASHASNLIGTDPLVVDEYALMLDAVAFNQEPNFISVVIITVNIDGELQGDYHLLSGSPAIDAGVTITAVPFDFDDEVRPMGAAYDIGADESSGSPPPPPPPAGPTVTVVDPASGDTLTGSFLLQFLASDDIDAASSLVVEWNIDGGPWQSTAFNSGNGFHEATWDTTTTSDGSHTLNARVTDTSANTALDSVVITIDNPVPPGCTTNCLRVRSIGLTGRAFGPTARVRGIVTVENQTGAVVPGATVFVTWTTPSGSSIATGTTNGAGRVTFNITGSLGTYTLTVDNIQLAGSTFDPGGSTTLTNSIPVP